MRRGWTLCLCLGSKGSRSARRLTMDERSDALASWIETNEQERPGPRDQRAMADTPDGPLQDRHALPRSELKAMAARVLDAGRVHTTMLRAAASSEHTSAAGRPVRSAATRTINTSVTNANHDRSVAATSPPQRNS
jgi:hypothetical protein